MAEFEHDIDEDDMEHYRNLSVRQTELDMEFLQLQSYIENKYLAGSEYDEGNAFIDWVKGVVYFWT